MSAMLLTWVLLLDVSAGPSKQDSSCGGKYSEKVLVIKCPKCSDSHGKFLDFGFWDGTRWTCPDDGHEFLLEEPGYWVYANGAWHIYKYCKSATSD